MRIEREGCRKGAVAADDYLTTRSKDAIGTTP
jgi:hypothetical protein